MLNAKTNDASPRLKQHLRRATLGLAGGLALALSGGLAFADPAKVLIPANPGGGWDGAGRQTMAAMNQAKIFTDGVNFTNKGGAAGTIGLASSTRNQRCSAKASQWLCSW